MRRNIVSKRLLVLLILILIVMQSYMLVVSRLEINSLLIELESADKSMQILYKEMDDLRTITLVDEGEDTFQGGINYIEPNEAYRFVETKLDLLALPHTQSHHLRTIRENTLVDIIDYATVHGEYWYFVSIPVWDTPSDFKGWVKQTDTLPFTKGLEERVQGEVCVKEGTEVYEVYEYERISEETAIILDDDIKGYLEERKDSYVHLSLAGGNDIWVEEKNIVYPSAEEEFKDTDLVLINSGTNMIVFDVPEAWEGNYVVYEVENSVHFAYKHFTYENGGYQDFFSVRWLDNGTINEKIEEGRILEEYVIRGNEMSLVYRFPLDVGIDDPEKSLEYTSIFMSFPEQFERITFVEKNDIVINIESEINMHSK